MASRISDPTVQQIHDANSTKMRKRIMTLGRSSLSTLKMEFSYSVLFWRYCLALWIVPLNGLTPGFSRFHEIGHTQNDVPKLVLIGGATGTGKSTFGMSVALQEGILKCISTDTIRAVMRSFVSEEVSPALHRSSYAPAFPDDDDPVRSWKETCTVLHGSVASLIDDAIERRVSLVVEGVHLIPSDKLTRKWQDAGGIAVGCLLQIHDAEAHKALLQRRGYLTGNMDKENLKIASYDRIRCIQEEMMALADASGWLRIEQKVESDPLDVVSARLWGVELPHSARPQMVFRSHQATHSILDKQENKIGSLEELQLRLHGDGNSNLNDTKSVMDELDM